MSGDHGPVMERAREVGASDTITPEIAPSRALIPPLPLLLPLAVSGPQGGKPISAWTPLQRAIDPGYHLRLQVSMHMDRIDAGRYAFARDYARAIRDSRAGEADAVVARYVAAESRELRDARAAIQRYDAGSRERAAALDSALSQAGGR